MANSIDLYRKLIEQQIHKSHFGLSANLLILWVFSTRSNEARFQELLSGLPEHFQRHFLTQNVGGLGRGALFPFGYHTSATFTRYSIHNSRFADFSCNNADRVCPPSLTDIGLPISPEIGIDPNHN